MYLAYELTDKSYQQIGRSFSYHHTTVMEAVGRVQARIDPHSPEYDAKFAATLARCRARLEVMPGDDVVMVGAEYTVAI